MARTIGIEFEFAAHQNWDNMRTALESKGLDVNIRQTYCHTNGVEWELKTDATAGYRGMTGYELASRILRGDDNLIELYWYAQALDNLRASNNWKIHKGCGLHVHIDVADFSTKDIQRLVKLVLHHERTLLAMQPPSRRETTFAKSINHSTFIGIATGNEYSAQSTLNDMRYNSGFRTYGLNLVNFTTRSTIEFRYSAATLNPNKVLAWVAVLLGLVEKAKHSRSVRIDDTKSLHDRKDDLRKMVSKLRGIYGTLHKSGLIHRTIEERFEKFGCPAAV